MRKKSLKAIQPAGVLPDKAGSCAWRRLKKASGVIGPQIGWIVGKG